nr:transposase [[Haemophilus] ducreyi]
MRWGSKQHVTCPKCGVQHQAYFIASGSTLPLKLKSKNAFYVTDSPPI